MCVEKELIYVNLHDFKASWLVRVFGNRNKSIYFGNAVALNFAFHFAVNIENHQLGDTSNLYTCSENQQFVLLNS